MSGEFSNMSRSVSEADNVNFFIDGDDLGVTGSYGFFGRFYRDGDLVGTLNLGTRELRDTADLRILVKVEIWPMSDAAWDTLKGALQFLQRNLPLRSGVAPMGSDLSAGLRYFIDPIPFDPDWPGWGPARQALKDFNDQQSKLGSPDRADKLMTVRMQQPGEGPLGGTAELGGAISGVVLNVNPPGDNYFATIVSQEVGHNFSLNHVTDTFIPSSETAFDMLNRKSLGSAVNIMHNPVGPNEFCMFGPTDWHTVRENLLKLPSSGPP
jgi:hypothetical protein